MNKQANDSIFPHDPKTTLLLSLLMGGGLYGAARGAKDIHNHLNPKPSPYAQQELAVDIPKDRMKMANLEEGQNPYGASHLVPQVLALLGGTGAGFLGASKMYEGFEKKRIDADNDGARQRYLQMLQQAHTKTANQATPLVDKFCEGIAAKIAQNGDLSEIPGNFGHWLSTLPGKASETTPGGIAASTLALLGLGSAGATYHLSNKIDQAKEDNRQKQTIPQYVRINEV